MQRLRWWAMAALALAAVALVFLLRPRAPLAAHTQVEYPRWHEEEVVRAQKRATLVLPAPRGARAAAVEPPQAEPKRRDPFLVALPVKPDSPVVVFEANALRNSRLGELLVSCLQKKDPGKLADMERDTGIDPLKDVDRVAFMGDALVVSGFFERARWDQLGGEAATYGDAGRIYQKGGKALGAWGNGIVVIADRAEDVRRAIDQLEGRAPVPAAGIPEEMTYGEIYGVVPASAVGRLLGGADSSLADRLAALASRIEVNVGAMDQVAATVRIRGADAGGLADLARSLGETLAQARQQAHGAGDPKLMQLLDSAAVRPGEEELTIQLAVPADGLAAWFDGCERWGPRQAQAQ